MLSWHKTVLFGYLGNDANLRYTQTGQAVSNFNVAASSGKKDQNGEWVNHTTWYHCTLWGELAEKMNSFLLKGTPVYIEGELTSNEYGHPKTYETQDGSTRANYDLRVVNVNVLSERTDTEQPNKNESDQEEDDIPF